MKTLGKIGLGFFIAFLVLLVAGCVVLAGTGELSMAMERAFQPANIGWLSYEKIDEEDMEYQDNQELSLDGVKTIVLEVSACELNIEQVSGLSKLKADFASDSRPRGRYAKMGTSRQGDTLYIQVKQEHRGFWWFQWKTYSTLDVAIPESYQGALELDGTACQADVGKLALEQEVKISFSAGQLNLEGLKADRLTVDSTATDLNLGHLELAKDVSFSTTANSLQVESLKAEKLEIQSTGAGVNIKGLEAAVTCDSTAAGIQMEFARVVGDITIENTAATTELTFPKGAPIRVIAEGLNSVSDHIEWTGDRSREMKDYQYEVRVDGTAAQLVLKEK